MKFEDRLAESAQRITEKENATLHVPQNPREQKKVNWGWIATPAAAVVGVLLGLSFQWGQNDEKAQNLLAKADTVFVDRNIKDTIYLTKTIEKEHVVEKVVWKEKTNITAEKIPQEQSPASLPEPACTSIQCDGINYALLGSY